MLPPNWCYWEKMRRAEKRSKKNQGPLVRNGFFGDPQLASLNRIRPSPPTPRPLPCTLELYPESPWSRASQHLLGEKPKPK